MGRRALLLLIAVTALRASTLVVEVFNHDEACIAVQAQALLHGDALYKDTADRKPPALPYVYAAVFAATDSSSLVAVHVLAILIVWLTALAMWREAGEPAAWLYVATSVALLPIDAMPASFELFMLLPSTLAMVVARRRGIAAAVLAGVLVALACLCKQTALVMLLPVAVRLRDARIVAMAAGFTAVIAAVAAALGAHELYFWTIGGNGGYLAVDSIAAQLPHALAATALFGGSTLAVWWLVARSLWRGQLDRWAWLAANVVAVSAGLRFFGHYYLHLLPPACALAAGPLAQLAPRIRTRAIAFTWVVATAYATLGFWGRTLHGMPDYQPLADEVRRRTGPDDRVAIWGNYPEVLWAADRRSAIRFVHSHFITGFSTGRPAGPATYAAATPGARAMMLADLAAHPPALLIDTSPAGFRDYGHYPMVSELAAYVAAHLHRVAVVDGMVLYAR